MLNIFFLEIASFKCSHLHIYSFDNPDHLAVLNKLFLDCIKGHAPLKEQNLLDRQPSG